MKNKSILFCDFNGVLSYKKYWSTINSPNNNYHHLHPKIVKYLFIENPTIVEEWMVGKYSLEEINAILSKLTGIPLFYLLKIFKDECVNLDVSNELL